MFQVLLCLTIDITQNSLDSEEDEVICIVNDNEEPRPQGRKTNEMKVSADNGEKL